MFRSFLLHLYIFGIILLWSDWPKPHPNRCKQGLGKISVTLFCLRTCPVKPSEIVSMLTRNFWKIIKVWMKNAVDNNHVFPLQTHVDLCFPFLSTKTFLLTHIDKWFQIWPFHICDLHSLLYQHKPIKCAEEELRKVKLIQ